MCCDDDPLANISGCVELVRVCLASCQCSKNLSLCIRTWRIDHDDGVAFKILLREWKAVQAVNAKVMRQSRLRPASSFPVKFAILKTKPLAVPHIPFTVLKRMTSNSNQAMGRKFWFEQHRLMSKSSSVNASMSQYWVQITMAINLV